MDKAFKTTQLLAQNPAWKREALTHKQRVTRLYRQSLRLILSWCVDREVFYDAADGLRARFDALKSVNATTGASALIEGEKEYDAHFHPDKYCIPYMPGGTKFMRNPPLPLELCYPDGIPEDLKKEMNGGTMTPVWADSIPITWRPVMKSAIVDFTKKNME